MKAKGFTLIELIVVLIIIALTGMIFMSLTSKSDDPGLMDPIYWAPEVVNAEANRNVAQELKRQNDIREKEIQLQWEMMEAEKQR